MTTAWFHCFSGVAGDMALGALLDAGADVVEVRTIIERLGVDGWRLEAERVQRAGLRATRALVHTADQHTHADHGGSHDRPGGSGQDHRTFADIRTLLETADLPPRVHERALAVFTALAVVEGGLHGVSPEDVQFHEVGSLDAIVDVVGTCAALELLGIDRIRTSPVRVGHGTVRAAHGELPNPAPAALGLLASAGIAVEGVDTAVELATPTGVAILAALADGCGPVPALVPTAIGYGAGHRDTPGRANVVQVVVGLPVAGTGDGPGLAGAGQPMVELAANLDDATGEVLAHTVAALLASGANDAWITPIVMKKGRPAHTLHALCDPALAATVGAVFVKESGTLGLRATAVQRWPQRRDDLVVEVDGHPVRVKRSAGRIKVEHDDAARAAGATGRSLLEVQAEAVALARMWDEGSKG